ncbi:MAG: NAD(P)H-hydrate dehydratase [Acidobacteria bacterium]|nr:NAD(P)H-hydrate dehydratase [Acidobacteriota bacterium]MYJ05328.1 NAD(P)H-hydrate dehydratase [Acidobacteriota bacterium]
MRVVTATQMREADRLTIDERGVPSLELMERAGREVVAAIDDRLSERLDGGPVTVLCGRGNNGGDGWVVARLLRERGLQDIAGVLLGRIEDIAGDAREMLERARSAGVSIAEVEEETAWGGSAARLPSSSLIVDALVGTGLNRPLAGTLARAVSDVNASGRPVVSIDVPSGLLEQAPRVEARKDGDGPVDVDARALSVRAALTVTLAAPKLALLLHPDEIGALKVADIGIPPDVVNALDGPRIDLMTGSELRLWMPRRRVDAHKGMFGRVAIVAGSRGKTGAARLAGLGALRAGAGLVTVATPASCQALVASIPEYMTHALPERDGTIGRKGLAELLAGKWDVIAAGPGLGTGKGTTKLVQALIDRESSVPLVLDADALNVCAETPRRLRGRRGSPLVITPHAGEMARLAGTSSGAVERNRLGIASAFAQEHEVTVVLKGARTVIASPDGTVRINATGNPGMATGGSGDVLTGAIAGWIGQMNDLAEAVALAVYLHGLAGDLAARDMGQTGLIAGDIAVRLGLATAMLERGEAVDAW